MTNRICLTLLHPLQSALTYLWTGVNFLACQLFALAAAFWFRLYLSPHHANPLVRHAVATLLGIAFLIFCFGWYSAHILTVVVANYLIIVNADINNVHRYAMATAMGYLTVCQVSRAYIFNYGILSTDFSGPLMIVTQKITTLAFQLHDGTYKTSEQLTPEQKLQAIKSYGFSLQTAVCQKLLICLGCMLFFLIVTRNLPITFNVDPHFVAHAPFLTRLTYAFFSIQAARPKFYFAWTLADAVNNAAGYGFLGIDEHGKASWDLICNLNIVGIETATSFKTFIDNWNIRTGIWLKTVCYDRAPKHQLPLTFVLSALWHGVYPGYYFTFITAIPITIAARAIRKYIRHYFLGSRGVKMGYDILTWAATQLAICYTVMPFLLLAVDSTLVYYRSMYFHVHILSILAAIALHPKHKPRNPSAATHTLPSSSPSSTPPSPSAQCQLKVHSNNNGKLH
uniref:Membrane bound O-acyltransferase domain containing 1 n=1 Tax=Cynoglossus semilaevis TaxID=244447 RepID=A0A3P8UXV3_CYNSE